MAQTLECGLMNPGRQEMIVATASFWFSDVKSTDPFPAVQLPPKAAILRGKFAIEEAFDVATSLTISVNGTEILTDQNLNNVEIVDLAPYCAVSPNPETVNLQLNQVPTQGFARFTVEYIVIGRASFTQD